MPSVFRANRDYSQGHCYGPRKCLNGSPNVFAEGDSVVIIGSNYGQTHSCGDNSHAMNLAITGSSTVYVNGMGVHRTGDLVSCGDKAGIGCPTVISG